MRKLGLIGITNIVMALWAIAFFVFFQFWYPYHFFFQEQNQLFLWSWDYISTYNHNGGLALLLGDFLTQFYYYLYVGAIILTICLLLVGTLLYKALRNFKVGRMVALILALTVMTFMAVCHFSISYRLSSTIAMIGWCLLLWLVSMMNGWKMRLMLLALGILPTWLLFGLPEIKKLQGRGKKLQYDCYGDDGKNSGYVFYNDRFGAANDYSPAPTVCEYEFEKREDLMIVYNYYPLLMWNITNDILSCFLPSHLDVKDLKGYKAHNGGKTTLKGVECNYYYVTKENEDLQTDDDNLPVKYQELWVTDSFVCLQQVDSNKDTICTLSGFWQSGTFAENYEKITELFSVYGKTKLSEALHCHKKYGNCWLSDEYPELINKWLPLYEGNVKTFSVTRRAWMGLDNISNITVEIADATQDKVREYIATLKELNKFSSYSTNDRGWMINFGVDDPDDTAVSVDGVSLYPVIYLAFSNSNFEIKIDFLRLT